jgi:hypothetical protein
VTVLRLAKRVVPFRAGVARLASNATVLVRDGDLIVGNRMLLRALPEPGWRI